MDQLRLILLVTALNKFFVSEAKDQSYGCTSVSFDFELATKTLASSLVTCVGLCSVRRECNAIHFNREDRSCNIGKIGNLPNNIVSNAKEEKGLPDVYCQLRGSDPSQNSIREQEVIASEIEKGTQADRSPGFATFSTTNIGSESTRDYKTSLTDLSHEAGSFTSFSTQELAGSKVPAATIIDLAMKTMKSFVRNEGKKTTTVTVSKTVACTENRGSEMSTSSSLESTNFATTMDSGSPFLQYPKTQKESEPPKTSFAPFYTHSSSVIDHKQDSTENAMWSIKDLPTSALHTTKSMSASLTVLGEGSEQSTAPNSPIPRTYSTEKLSLALTQANDILQLSDLTSLNSNTEPTTNIHTPKLDYDTQRKTLSKEVFTKFSNFVTSNKKGSPTKPADDLSSLTPSTTTEKNSNLTPFREDHGPPTSYITEPKNFSTSTQIPKNTVNTSSTVLEEDYGFSTSPYLKGSRTHFSEILSSPFTWVDKAFNHYYGTSLIITTDLTTSNPPLKSIIPSSFSTEDYITQTQTPLKEAVTKHSSLVAFDQNDSPTKPTKDLFSSNISTKSDTLTRLREDYGPPTSYLTEPKNFSTSTQIPKNTINTSSTVLEEDYGFSTSPYLKGSRTHFSEILSSPFTWVDKAFNHYYGTSSIVTTDLTTSNPSLKSVIPSSFSTEDYITQTQTPLKEAFTKHSSLVASDQNDSPTKPTKDLPSSTLITTNLKHSTLNVIELGVITPSLPTNYPNLSQNTWDELPDHSYLSPVTSTITSTFTESQTFFLKPKGETWWPSTRSKKNSPFEVTKISYINKITPFGFHLGIQENETSLNPEEFNGQEAFIQQSNPPFQSISQKSTGPTQPEASTKSSLSQPVQSTPTLTASKFSPSEEMNIFDRFSSEVTFSTFPAPSNELMRDSLATELQYSFSTSELPLATSSSPEMLYVNISFGTQPNDGSKDFVFSESLQTGNDYTLPYLSTKELISKVPTLNSTEDAADNRHSLRAAPSKPGLFAPTEKEQTSLAMQTWWSTLSTASGMTTGSSPQSAMDSTELEPQESCLHQEQVMATFPSKGCDRNMKKGIHVLMGPWSINDKRETVPFEIFHLNCNNSWNKVEKYNLLKRFPFNSPRTNSMVHVLTTGEIVACGFEKLFFYCFAHDMEKSEWQLFSSFSQYPRLSTLFALPDNTLWLSGGVWGKKTKRTHKGYFLFRNGTVAEGKNLKYPGAAPCLFMAKGKVHATCYARGNFTNEVSQLGENSAWETRLILPHWVARECMCIYQSEQNLLWIMGGMNDTSTTFSDEVVQVDLNSEEVKLHGRLNFPLKWGTPFVFNKELFIAGGKIGGSVFSKHILRWNEENKQFEPFIRTKPSLLPFILLVNVV